MSERDGIGYFGVHERKDVYISPDSYISILVREKEKKDGQASQIKNRL